MTELGVEWHYEYEGFALPSGNYLPDFWLPGFRTAFPWTEHRRSELLWRTDRVEKGFEEVELPGTFLEIKGSHEYDTVPLQELAELTHCRVILLIGTPFEYLDAVRGVFDDGNVGGLPTSRPERSFLFAGLGRGDEPYFWTVCEKCSAVGLEFDGRSARISHRSGCPVLSSGADKNYNADDPRILRAIECSRRWRSPEGG